MFRRFMKVAVPVMATGALVLSVVTMASAKDAKLVVLPIDQAKFWAGQKFDLEVELQGAKADSIEILLNGKEAGAFFGAKQSLEATEEVTRLRFNDVAFKDAGSIMVEARAKAGQKEYSAVKNYTVVAGAIEKPVKNVILFIGDGMGLVPRQTARILSKGIVEGKYKGVLNMEELVDGTALLTTSGYDSLVTDSANSASAYATGHKSVVNAMGVYEDSSKDPFDHPKVENIVEIIKRSRGMSVGIVTTSDVTDATPGAFVAHTRRRAEKPRIAPELMKADVVMGGGSQNFLPKSVAGSRRADETDVIAQFKDAGYDLATDRNELAASKGDKLLGLFHLKDMNVYLDREMLKTPSVLKDFTAQPTLMDMTAKAIEVLSRNDKGFFLMVEGACIDKQLHPMDWQRAAYDTIELDKAVALAREYAAKNDDTLILVTADHSHGTSITGTYHELDGKTGREAVRLYNEAGFPSFRDEDGDGFPENPDAEVTLAIQYANAPDYYENYRLQAVPTVPAIMEGDKAVANPARSPKGKDGVYRQGVNPTSDSSEAHSADDVPLSAGGRGGEFFRGVMDNTEVFFGMMRALGIDATK